jgi:DNA repair protein RadC
MQYPLFSDPAPLHLHEPKAARQKRPYALPIYRVTLVREGTLATAQPQFRSSRDATAIVRAFLAGVDREHFVVLLLDRKNKLIGIHTVAIGSLTAAVVHPREVMKPAILANAAAILVAHNHPTGDPQPSREDRVLTARLYKAGELLGINVVDHIIVGDGTTASFSFADNNCLSIPDGDLKE